MPASGGETVIFIGDYTYRGVHGPYFSTGASPVVTIGNVTLSRPSLLNDSALAVVLPNISTLFPGAASDSAVEGYAVITISHASDDGVNTVSVSCPPACPGSATDVVVGGVFYTLGCAGAGYLSGSACLSQDTARDCGFGAGSQCSACPDGAYCPGGFRLW